MTDGGFRTARGRRARRAEAIRRERLVTAALRRETGRALTSVRFRKPGWMPRALYRWVVSSIVVEERLMDEPLDHASGRSRG